MCEQQFCYISFNIYCDYIFYMFDVWCVLYVVALCFITSYIDVVVYLVYARLSCVLMIKAYFLV